MTETLSCIKTNGNSGQQVRTGTRKGERTAERVGTAMGTRSPPAGHRDGTRTVARPATWPARSQRPSPTRASSNQITGFNMKGFAEGRPEFVAEKGEPTTATRRSVTTRSVTTRSVPYSFDAYDFQPYVWFGDFNFGATTWAEEFESGPNANPDLCVEGNKNIVPGSVQERHHRGRRHRERRRHDPRHPGRQHRRRRHHRRRHRRRRHLPTAT